MSAQPQIETRQWGLLSKCLLQTGSVLLTDLKEILFIEGSNISFVPGIIKSHLLPPCPLLHVYKWLDNHKMNTNSKTLSNHPLIITYLWGGIENMLPNAKGFPTLNPFPHALLSIWLRCPSWLVYTYSTSISHVWTGTMQAQAQAHFFLELVLALSRFTHSLCLHCTCKPAFIIILHCSCASMGRVGRKGESGTWAQVLPILKYPHHHTVYSFHHLVQTF